MAGNGRVPFACHRNPLFGGLASGAVGWGRGKGRGGLGCESLRGMGSGILGVMYYTPLGLGKGVGGSLSLGTVPT